MACWSCERPGGDGAFCDKCGAVQPPRAGRSHFSVLDTASSFDIDAAALEARFKEMARKLHPDRFARADVRARCYALEHATALNDAYRVLRDPLRRAECLIGLHGIRLDVHGIGGRSNVPRLDQAFLVEMLEVQEAIGEARAAGRGAEVERITAEIRLRREAELRGVAEDLREACGGGAPREGPGANGAMMRAGERVARVRFYDRVLSTAAGREESSA